ncbi:uncharacterized protein F4827_006214 [Paraburkholderia bannensis]|uniref:Deaminase n=1 Tax=Paraburkholderia bannensis TaxID=765414 RepID=A0A7W9U5I8_9BURK|nr:MULTISPECIES: PP0621 family protein [Paraburkholderia]MBB3261354.1 uncharacterized protein [Paraburkholderia sp. WP4_3_2]MBB6106340.1 uncharacterized protein [Paraburkholderia bannensis]
MRQILLLILLFFVGQWFVKTLRRAQPQARPGADPRQQGQGASRANGDAQSASGAGNSTGSGGALAEPMVRCAECGVHAPRSDSVSVGTQHFCSSAHARAYDARKTRQDRPAR